MASLGGQPLSWWTAPLLVDSPSLGGQELDAAQRSRHETGPHESAPVISPSLQCELEKHLVKECAAGTSYVVVGYNHNM